MRQEPAKQIDTAVLFSEQSVTQLMRHATAAKGSYCIDEQGMDPVKRVYVTATGGKLGPACGLDGSAGFEGEAVEVEFGGGGVEAAFKGEAAKLSVGGEVVEAVIVDADVGDVLGHVGDSAVAADLEELGLPSDVEAKNCVAVGEALSPLGPIAADVSSVDGDDGSSVAELPALVEREGLLSGKGEEPGDGSGEVYRLESLLDIHGRDPLGWRIE